MASLLDLIAQGSSIALNFIKNYTTQPLVGPVPIQAYRFERSMDAEVAKQVLIDLTQGKVNVMDNVAPGPRTWEIEGYIGGFPLEFSSIFMPSITIMEIFLDQMSQARQIVVLRDRIFRKYNVLIARYWCADIPDTMNRMTVRMTLVEVTVLSATLGTDNPVVQVEGLAGPSPGTVDGVPVDSGITLAQPAVWTPPPVLRGP